MDVTQRNDLVKKRLNDYFLMAQNGEYSELNGETSILLNSLINSTVWGFREIILVIALARIINPSYRASVKFYECNPRSLYEGPIREVLLKKGIPHRKSGPLNIAKAAEAINEAWAAQRRPADVAVTTVKLVRIIENQSESELENFTINLLKRLLNEAVRVESLVVDLPKEASPNYLFQLSKGLIDNAPDGGSTPQRIVGLLLVLSNEELVTGLVVKGYEDSVSSTNTTSKKPGDITEEIVDGGIKTVYEITVKPFSVGRVMESYEAVREYDNNSKSSQSTKEVFVICRPIDVHPDVLNNHNSSYFLGSLDYEDLTYYFVNIYEWVYSNLLHLTPKYRMEYYQKLNTYISNPNTNEKVKLYWQQIHQQVFG